MADGFGIFGKLPTKGDFVRGDLPEGFQPIWDDWLQRLLIAGKEALGANWDARYMHAPIWRFTLAAGVAGAAGMLGVMAPSIDRVGRRFPLTFVTSLEAGAHPILAHAKSYELFTDLEDVALAAVTEDLPLDDLMGQLGAIAPPRMIAAPSLTLTDNGTRVASTASVSLAQALAAAWTDMHYPGATVWSTEDPATGRTINHIQSGLPTPEFVPHLFPANAQEPVL